MTQHEIIIETAQKLATEPAWLDALIKFESGYSPTIKNKASTARGLIQFTDDSARMLGYKDSAALVTALPTFETQMRGAVLPYLKYWGPYPSQQSLYMAVFYPKFRYSPVDTVFPDSVQKVNPGIVTVQDYIHFVNRRISFTAVKKSASLAGLVLAGALVYMFVKYVR